MSISLEKRTEKVGILLQKKGLNKIPAVRVGLALDHSGSAAGFYSSGQMQETVERLMGVAMKFDDNGELDLWYFHNRCVPAKTVTKDNLSNCVDRTRRETGIEWGGTAYAPVLSSMTNHYFNSNPTQAVSNLFGAVKSLFGSNSNSSTVMPKPLPAYGIMVTDGVSDDPSKARKVLEESAKHNMYWTLVGLGSPSNFSMLKQAADDLDNVGFVNLNDLSLTDDQLYEQLITDEVVNWLKKC